MDFCHREHRGHREDSPDTTAQVNFLQTLAVNVIPTAGRNLRGSALKIFTSLAGELLLETSYHEATSNLHSLISNPSIGTQSAFLWVETM
jgi:hypothetical protein